MGRNYGDTDRMCRLKSELLSRTLELHGCSRLEHGRVPRLELIKGPVADLELLLKVTLVKQILD